MSDQSHNPTIRQTNRRSAVRLLIAAVAMFGFGYALVPLYDIFCDLTGLGGRTNMQAIAQSDVSKDIDQTRTITVEFVASIDRGAPWAFEPSVRKMQVHPGEFYNTSYIAENLSTEALTGHAVPSVAPAEGSLYFQKIECFCFNQQDFEAGEKKDMPLVFRIDPDLPVKIDTVTLSYTFFKLKQSES